MKCSICGWPADDFFGFSSYEVGDETICSSCNALMGYAVQTINGSYPGLLSGERLRAHLREDMPYYLDEMRDRERHWAFDHGRPIPTTAGSDFRHFLTLALSQESQ